MEIIGVICEYNPFHNGHIYHINKIKELYPDSLIILVLNGYFLERGEISLLSKEEKVKIALNHHVDLILELPVIYGTQSADIFAYYAVKILNCFHINRLIFGSESNDLNKLKEIVNIQKNDLQYNKRVKKFLASGTNYPTALAQALNIDINFNNPNDLLAISYLKAINKINKNIVPQCIKRTSSYYDLESNNKIVSATNIRNKLKNKQDIRPFLPQDAYKFLSKVDEDLLFKLIKFKIKTDNNLSDYLTVDEGIENRLKKVIDKVDNFVEFINKMKTKRYTYNKINRMLIHILLGIKKEYNLTDLEYIKILGFNLQGQKYLTKIKKEIPYSLKSLNNSLTKEIENRAAFIYDILTNQNTQAFEKANKPIIDKK